MLRIQLYKENNTSVIVKQLYNFEKPWLETYKRKLKEK